MNRRCAASADSVRRYAACSRPIIVLKLTVSRPRSSRCRTAGNRRVRSADPPTESASNASTRSGRRARPTANQVAANAATSPRKPTTPSTPIIPRRCTWIARIGCAATTYPDRPRSARAHGTTRTRVSIPATGTVPTADPARDAAGSNDGGTSGGPEPMCPVAESTAPEPSSTTTTASPVATASTDISGVRGASSAAGSSASASTAAVARLASSWSWSSAKP